MTLTEFLLARIAEDEVVARSATRPPWIDDANTPAPAVYSPTDDSYVTDPHNWDAVGSDTAHIARHDPARVIAECEAKRQVIALEDRGYDMEQALRSLAAIYSDHEDYQEEEWKP